MTKSERSEETNTARTTSPDQDATQTHVPAPDRDVNGNPINPDGTPVDSGDSQR